MTEKLVHVPRQKIWVHVQCLQTPISTLNEHLQIFWAPLNPRPSFPCEWGKRLWRILSISDLWIPSQHFSIEFIEIVSTHLLKKSLTRTQSGSVRSQFYNENNIVNKNEIIIIMFFIYFIHWYHLLWLKIMWLNDFWWCPFWWCLVWIPSSLQ